MSSRFENWQVAKMTPSRVDTPDGSISVAWTCNYDGGARNQRAEDAARLIAAAPDSHEANVRMVKALNNAFHIRPYMDDDQIYDELPSSGVATAYFAAREAIAKATGPDQ